MAVFDAVLINHMLAAPPLILHRHVNHGCQAVGSHCLTGTGTSYRDYKIGEPIWLFEAKVPHPRVFCRNAVSGKQVPSPVILLTEKRQTASGKPQPLTMSQLQDTVGVGDMVLLDPISEDNLITNLKKRFNSGQIYVLCFFPLGNLPSRIIDIFLHCSLCLFSLGNLPSPIIDIFLHCSLCFFLPLCAFSLFLSFSCSALLGRFNH